MTVQPAEMARDLLAKQRKHYALLQPFYLDEAMFKHDVERIVMRHWLCVGHQSSVPKPGDWMLFEVAGESVIIARGKDGAVNAFMNVCRHRGSRVCREKQGHSDFLVCPYHAWTYGLDGKLESARHMGSDFDLKGHGLKPVHIVVIQGLIFVSFAQKPLGLDHVRATLDDCFGPYDWTNARVAHRETYQIQSNWKLAVENYTECYHCGPSHPEYSKLHALEQPLARIEKMNADMTARASAIGVNISEHHHFVPSESGQEAIYGFRYALYPGVLTGSPDGKPMAPLMGKFSDYDGGVTSVHMGSGSFFISYADHGVLYRFIPKTALTCEMELIWLVRGDAREGVDYDLDKLTWLWRVTSVSDKRIVEDNQLGVNSRFYEPGPYAPMEYNAKQYVDWYLTEIA